MQFNKLSKICIVVSAVLGLAACSSTKNSDTTSTNTNATSTVSVQPLDNEFGFLSDPSLTMQQLLSLCTYYFEFNKTDVLGANLQAAQAHGQYLSTNKGKKVLLKGYTDIQGSYEYNVGLGYRRSKAISAVLMSQGTTKQQIEMVSYGPEYPVNPEHTQHAYQQNRRVELAYCEGASCKSAYTHKALKGSVK